MSGDICLVRNSAAAKFVTAPPSRLRLASVSSIGMLIAVVIAALCIFRTDIYATATARVQQVGRSKLVQTRVAGRVRAIHVWNGDRVQEGQVLVELDPTQMNADRAVQVAQLSALSGEIARRTVAVAIARADSRDAVPEIAFDPGVAPNARASEQAVLTADISALRSSLDELSARIAENVAERNALRSSLDIQSRVIDTLQQRLNMRQELHDKHYESAANVLAMRQDLDTQTAVAVSQRGQMSRLDAAIVTLRRQREGMIAKFISDNTQALAATRQKHDEVTQNLVKAGVEVRDTAVRAPAAGTVQELSVMTVGQVLSAGQQLMKIVPTQGALEVEAFVPNSDIGFVRLSQPAIVKVDAFPYILYGVLSGTVVRVSRDAVADSEMNATESVVPAPPASGSTEATQGPYYAVTIRLERDSMHVGGKDVALVPGMTATAEIKTDERSLMTWLIAPLIKITAESAHER